MTEDELAQRRKEALARFIAANKNVSDKQNEVEKAKRERHIAAQHARNTGVASKDMAEAIDVSDAMISLILKGTR